jgi:hypothetical protein
MIWYNLNKRTTNTWVSWISCAFLLLRTIADYYINWHYYFPVI